MIHSKNAARLWPAALVVLILASLACNLPGTGGAGATVKPTPIPVTTEAVETLKQSLETAAGQAAAGGPVTLEMTEEQLTSVIAFELQSQNDVVISQPQVLLRDGLINISGEVQQGPLNLPLIVAIALSTDGAGKPTYAIQKATIGPMPLPESLLSMLTDQLDQTIGEQMSFQGKAIYVESITIADGKMTITGRTQ